MALEAAYLALLADSFGHLLFVIGLNGLTSIIIHENLLRRFCTISFNISAILVGLRMDYAVVLDQAATLLSVSPCHGFWRNEKEMATYARPRDSAW